MENTIKWIREVWESILVMDRFIVLALSIILAVALLTWVGAILKQSFPKTRDAKSLGVFMVRCAAILVLIGVSVLWLAGHLSNH